MFARGTNMAALLCGGVSCRFSRFYCEESEVTQRNHEFFSLTQFSVLEIKSQLPQPAGEVGF